jgi:hypothetical protein
LYDINFIRAICRDLSDETDQVKIEELMSLLRSVMKEEREEFRARIKFLSWQYSHLLGPENR